MSAWITPFMKQCFVTSGVDLSMICFGCALGFPPVLLSDLYEPDSKMYVGPQIGLLIQSGIGFGQLFGYFLAPFIMGRFGRKVTHCLVSVLFIIGWLAIAFANDYRVIITFTIVKGIASGLLLPLSSILLAECSSQKNRGAFLATITFSECLGIYLVFGVLRNVLRWQTVALFCMIFPIVSLIMTIYTPESPSWYLSRGKYDKFIEVFRWFRGNVEEEELRSMLGSKLDKDKTEVEDTNGNCFSNMKEVMKKEFYKPLIITIHSTIIVMAAGSLTFMSHSVLILNELIGRDVDYHMWSHYTIIANLLLYFITIFLIHKLDRRFMLLSSGGLCILSHVGLGCYSYAISAGWFQKTSWIAILLLSLLIISNAVGIVPLSFVTAGEVFPLRYRSIGASIGFACQTIIMFIVFHNYLPLVETITLPGTYLLYGLIVLYILLILWFMLPETRGRTLFQIEQGFKGKQMQQNDVVLTEFNVK